MATHLRDSTTINSLADICDSIAGALETDPKTEQLAPDWITFTSKADKLVIEQQKLERKHSRARTRLAVQDAIWDPEIAAFGRATVDASNGKRDVPPYTRFFKELPPSEVQKLVPEKEIAFAEGCIAELNRNPQEPLAVSWISRIKVVTEALSKALDARSNAEKEQQLLEVSRGLLLRDVNQALDVIEGDLQKIFPGDTKRVSSYLSSTKPSVSTTKAADTKKAKDEAPSGS